MLAAVKLLQSRAGLGRYWMPALLLVATVPAAQWTIGIYMCADNGLNDQAYVDLAELRRIGSTSEVNIVVQVDNAARDSNPGCRRYLVEKDRLRLLREMGEVDMADTAVLAGFGRFLASTFPANEYLFVLWNHGSGWSEGYGPNRSILIDESHAHAMGVAGGELKAAVGAVRRSLGQRIRVLGFDACLMGMIEVACEVREDADYLLASEGLVPWGGWPYDELVGRLTARPTSTPAEFLAGMCADYVKEYPGEDVCLSGIDLRQLDRVLPVLATTVADSIDATDPGVAAARLASQTFPASGSQPPCAADDQVDLVDFWERVPVAGTGALRTVLVPLAVANATGGHYAGARGLAFWFPDNYLAFKASVGSYRKLALADTVRWLEFLNRYFRSDDVKPSQPEIAAHRLGSRGDVRLWWHPSSDLAEVSYDLYETVGREERFVDYAEDLARWSAIGWTTSEREAHSGSRSFFSGSASNLSNELVQVEPLALEQGGLLSFYARFSTEEALDSTGFKRDICYVEWSDDKLRWWPLDSLYGESGWREFRYLLPATGRLYLRFHYVSDGSGNGLGAFVDDVKVFGFEHHRLALGGIGDTTCYLFNLPAEEYGFLVTATDAAGNVSMVSQAYPLTVTRLGEPHTRPAPFAGECRLCYDVPDGTTVGIRVYTVSGTLVWKAEGLTDDDNRVRRDGSWRQVDWDGRNQAGRELADGLYVVTVAGEGFHTVGKIARVAR